MVLTHPLGQRSGRLGHRCAHLVAITCVFLGAVLCQATAFAESGWSALTDGTIVLYRHANAPGVGDPANFKLGDCSTQRNLDAAGRAQARHIGAQFRLHRIPVRRVLTSQWCRTRETAQLAFPGMPIEAEAFNSFFGSPERNAAQTSAALKILGQWKGPGVLVVVTHQVNITALTQVVPAAGEGVVVRPDAGALEVVARLPSDGGAR